MRVRFQPPRVLLAALVFLCLACPIEGSLGATFTSEAPMRVDLELAVSRAGDVTVVLWEDTWELGVGGRPTTLTMVVATGEPDTSSVDRLKSLATSTAAAAFAAPSGWDATANGAWFAPRAALIDDVGSDPVTDFIAASTCCSPNLTDHVRTPFTGTDPANLYTTRNGTHEWDPVYKPPGLPVTNLVLSLGSAESDALNDGMTFARVVALRRAIAVVTGTRESDVALSYAGAGRPKHAWAPVVVLHGYAAANFNPDLAAGLLRRDVVREAVAFGLGLAQTHVAVAEVADEPESERAAGEGATRFNFTIRDVVDPGEVERAWALAEDATFLSAAKTRMLSNALWELVAVSGRRGVGVTAVVTAEVRPTTAGAWVKVANGGGVDQRDVNAAMASYGDSERVVVTAVTREYVLGAGVAFSPPRLSAITDAPPTPATQLDVVHRSGFARRMSVLVVRFAEADFAENGQHVFRLSFHNQRPGVAARVAVVDGSVGGDVPWFGRTVVTLSRPPYPPPAPFPPPQIRGLDTSVTAGPLQNSVSALGTSFQFTFAPLAGCLTCGVPAGTTVFARVGKEPVLVFGEWQVCTAVDVEAQVTVLGGLNVTRTVKRFRFTHDPVETGAYRVQAKSVFTDSQYGLEDISPVESRYIVGEVVFGFGVLDRKTGVLSVTFSADVPFGEANGVVKTATELLNPESSALLGPGVVRVSWPNPRTLSLTLPPARECGLCGAWRDKRAAALAHAVRNNRPDVPVRLWTDPADVSLPTTMEITWRNPTDWYDVQSGFQMTKTVVVTIDDSKRGDDAGVVIAGARVSGGCQTLQLAAVAKDGSWDGVARWSFDDVVWSPNGPSRGDSTHPVPEVSEHPGLLEIVVAANSERQSALRLDPTITRPGLRYEFGASLTDCAGQNSTAVMQADRVAGAVPFVFPTTGAVEYVTRFSRSFTIAMETKMPDVELSVATYGRDCDVDVTALTFLWTNLSSNAPCFFSTVRSSKYDGYERSQRARRNTLTIPPFCLAPQVEPHVLELFASYGTGGSGGGVAASRTEVFVTVTNSPLLPAMAGGVGPRRVAFGVGDFVLDASSSYDPDEGAPYALAMQHVFFWSCGVVRNVYKPDLTSNQLDYKALNALYEAPAVRKCDALIDEILARAGGGAVVPPGVSAAMAIDTLYRFTVQYTVGMRSANVSTLVHAVEERVPTVTLRTPTTPQASGAATRLVGLVSRSGQLDTDGAEPVGAITLAWTAVPAVDFSDHNNFLTSTDATALVIAPNVLLPGQKYVFTLVASQFGVNESGYATTTAVEVVGPPALGLVVVTPAEGGSALSTEFAISTLGWGGGGVLLYSIGYVTQSVGGMEAEVFLTRQQASRDAKGVLPCDVGLVAGEVTVFAYAEVPGGGGAVARAETTVRVVPLAEEEVTAAARAALDAAQMLEDLGSAAAAAAAACAAMNPSGNKSFVALYAVGAEEKAARAQIRAGAMALVIASASVTLDIVNEDPGVVLDPDLVGGLIVAVATIAAVPSEMTARAAALGIETVAALLNAPTARSLKEHAVDAAVGLFDVGLTIVAIWGGDLFQGLDEGEAEETEKTISNSSSSRRRLKRFRRALSQSDETNVTGATNSTTSEPTTTATQVTLNPLAALALDGCTLAAAAAVRGRVANETTALMFRGKLSVSAARKFPSDLFFGKGVDDFFSKPITMNHAYAASWSFPASVMESLNASQHADLSLYRIDAGTVPSTTRAMSDACAVDLVDDAGHRVFVAEEEEITALFQIKGTGLLELEKVVYQYQCVRHVGGVWVSDGVLVRTGKAVELASTETEKGRQVTVSCHGKGDSFLGFLVGVSVVPKEFVASDEKSQPTRTLDAYWFVMVFTLFIGTTAGACALKRGMRRYDVRVANSDNAVANKA